MPKAKNRHRPKWAEDLAASLPPLLTIKQAAPILRCSMKTIRRRIGAGLLPVLRHGDRCIVIPRESVLTLLGA